MQRPHPALVAAIILALALVALAFVAAPRSCGGGLELYFGAGVIALVVLAILPFVTRLGESLPRRAAWSAAFALFGTAAWLAGLFAANVRIMCRLF